MGKPKKKKNKGASGAPLAPATLAPFPAPAASGKRKKQKKKSWRNKSHGPAAPPAAAVTANPAAASVPPASCNYWVQNVAASGEGIAGFIFFCDERTKPECYRNRVFGFRRKKAEAVSRIKQGAVLFLFDVKLRILYGVYQATSDGGLNLVPEAFGGKFPAQVRFKIDKDCPPLPESTFKHAIHDNYKSKFRFRPELTSQQVNKLLSLFRPITLLQQPPPPQIVEDQGLPPPSHLPHPEDPYRSGHMTSVPPSEDPRYVPQIIPPPVNESYVPTQHCTCTPPAVDARYVPAAGQPPPNDTYYPAPPTDSYHQRESKRTYYPENLIPSERTGYRVVPELIPRDQLPVPAREYRPHAGMECEVVPRTDRLDERYNLDRAAVRGPIGLTSGHSHWMPAYQDPNQIYADNSQRPALSGAMPTVPAPPQCSCAGVPRVAPAYR